MLLDFWRSRISVRALTTKGGVERYDYLHHEVRRQAGGRKGDPARHGTGVDYGFRTLADDRVEIVWKSEVPVEVVGAPIAAGFPPKVKAAEKPEVPKGHKGRTPTAVGSAAIDELTPPKAKRARAEKPAEAGASKPPRRRASTREAFEAAQKGKLPQPPDFSAATHKPYRARLAVLVELVKAGDLAGLEAVEMLPPAIDLAQGALPQSRQCNTTALSI